MKYIVIEVDEKAANWFDQQMTWEEATRSHEQSTWFGYPARIVTVLDEAPVLSP